MQGDAPKPMASARWSRRDVLSAAAAAPAAALALGGGPAAADERCSAKPGHLSQRDLARWTVELPRPRKAFLRPALASDGIGTARPTGPGGVVRDSQGVAPEFCWRHGDLSNCTPPAPWTGEPAPGRPQEVFVGESAGALLVPQFCEMTAKPFWAEIVPGYLTPMLGYAAATVGPHDDVHDASKRADATASSPGPLFEVGLGEPVVVRVVNELTALDLDVSVHLHGGHTPAHSDGHPNFLVPPGQVRDYYYPNGVPKKVTWKPAADGCRGSWVPTEAWDLSEVPSTMWYHDHANDITAHNALMGLAGMYFLRDAAERRWIEQGLLPKVEHEVPLAIRDVCLCRVESVPDDEGLRAEIVRRRADDPAWVYRGEAAIQFNPFDHDGALGNLVLLNGVPAPKLTIPRERHRFRILNASLARLYNLQFVRVHRGRGTFDVLALEIVGKDSWLLERPVAAGEVFMGMANRHDVIVDFARPRAWDAEKGVPGADLELAPDDELYLISTLNQSDGRGPGHGDNQVDPIGAPRGALPDVPDDRAAPMWLMKVELAARADPTPGPGAAPVPAVPKEPEPVLRPHEPILDTLVGAWGKDWLKCVPRRVFQFERRQGAWQINHKFYEECVANAVPVLRSTELWVLRNRSGGWWHPIHIHLESHQQVWASARDERGRKVLVVDPGYQKALDAIPDRGDFPELDEALGRTDRPGAPATEPAAVVGAVRGDLVDVLRDAGIAPGVGRTTWNTAIKHDTTVLGPNTEVHVLMRFRTFQGPFVFHCHNLNHEDMRMMHQFDPRLVEAPMAEVPVRRSHWYFTRSCEGK